MISCFKLTSEKTKGSAIYCEKGGNVIVNGAIFTDNSAAKGTDIYTERKADIDLADGLNVNVNNKINNKFSAIEIILLISAIILLIALYFIIKSKRPNLKQFLFR